MNCFCWCSSNPAKNSSISGVVGIALCVFRARRLADAVHVGLVVEPGVPMVSEPLIKLQGVLSRVLLHVHAENFSWGVLLFNYKIRLMYDTLSQKPSKIAVCSPTAAQSKASRSETKLHPRIMNYRLRHHGHPF